MDKQKQIEEIARDIDEFCQKELGAVFNDDILANFAEHLYNAGCRKQSEGEWIDADICAEDMYCSVCGGISPVDCEKEAFFKSNYCPSCGAKMKGGE